MKNSKEYKQIVKSASNQMDAFVHLISAVGNIQFSKNIIEKEHTVFGLEGKTLYHLSCYHYCDLTAKNDKFENDMFFHSFYNGTAQKCLVLSVDYCLDKNDELKRTTSSLIICTNKEKQRSISYTPYNNTYMKGISYFPFVTNSQIASLIAEIKNVIAEDKIEKEVNCLLKLDEQSSCFPVKNPKLLTQKLSKMFIM